MSAGFDAVDISILFDRLETADGLSMTVLALVTDRHSIFQRAGFDGISSPTLLVQFWRSSGSVLEPLPFFLDLYGKLTARLRGFQPRLQSVNGSVSADSCYRVWVWSLWTAGLTTATDFRSASGFLLVYSWEKNLVFDTKIVFKN